MSSTSGSSTVLTRFPVDEDRRLWKSELPQSREFSAALASYPREFGLWSNFDIDHLKVEGTALLRYKDTLVQANLERVRMGTICGYQVPIVNVTAEVRSEVGDALCRRFSPIEEPPCRFPG